MSNLKIIGGFVLLAFVVILIFKLTEKKKSSGEDNLFPEINLNLDQSKVTQTPPTGSITNPNPSGAVEDVTKLQIKDDRLGTGEEALTGKKVTVNYMGVFLDGKKFDSSYDRNTPFTFTLGAGEVIKGWDMGVLGMKVGGRRRLLVPADLAYGENGAGSTIPPNTPLIFAIELLKVE